MLKTDSPPGVRTLVLLLGLLLGLGSSLACGPGRPSAPAGTGGMAAPSATGGRAGGGPGGSPDSMNGAGGRTGSGGSSGAGGAAAMASVVELQYGGSISVERALSSAGTGEVERLEISAPILPRVLVLYQGERDNFPGDAEGQAKLAHDSSLTFDVLLKECPAKYPQIVTPGPGDPPTTPEQNASNLEAIATCAYEQYTAKPYWIPALIDKVEICATELGADWHLPTEPEIESLGGSNGAEIAKALTTPNSSRYFGNFYFGLSVWTRGTNGTLRIGDLSPAASQRVVDSPVPATSKVHYEGGVGLRCIRRVVVDHDPVAP
jgi:hypothetical protein